MRYLQLIRLMFVLGVLASASLVVLAGRSLWMWLNGIDGSGLAVVLEVIGTVAVTTAVGSLDFADPPSLRSELFPVLGSPLPISPMYFDNRRSRCVAARHRLGGELLSRARRPGASGESYSDGAGLGVFGVDDALGQDSADGNLRLRRLFRNARR